MKKIIRILIVGALCAFFLCIGIWSWRGKQKVEFIDCLDETAFTLNDKKTQMKELGFYVVYEEGEIEKQALVYNPENTRDYWNLHVDGVFMQAKAKDVVMQMAIHDALFYEKAMEEGLKLDADEENCYRNVMTDFWMDLLDEQVERMPVSDEYINEAMHRIALAQKYQKQLAEETEKSYAAYDWDGYAYQELLEKQDLKINEKLWERITVGNISLNHGKPNYINGHNKKESE